MKLNHWLADLGLTWEDLPGNYIPKLSLRKRLARRWYKIKCGICYSFSALEDKAPEYDDYFNKQAFDIRNKEDKEGFCDYEFFSLDYSMALYIYPRLCEFREKYAPMGTPSSFCWDEEGKGIDSDIANKNWLETIDKMILAFKLIIKDETVELDEMRKQDEQIQEGLNLFAKYYRNLWW